MTADLKIPGFALDGASQDTKPFKGTWASVSTVTFANRPSQPTTVRLSLQDGKQRSLDVSTPVTWDEANGVADLGYDEAGSQGNDKWKYWYAVPNSGDDDLLTVRVSDNPPSTGPTGYTNWCYIWSTYDSGGDLKKVYQIGNHFSYEASGDGIVYSGGDAGYIEHEASYASVDISAVVPETATFMQWHTYIDMSPENPAAYWVIRWSLNGTTHFHLLNPKGDISTTQNGAFVIQMPVRSDRTIYRKRERSTGALDLGWISYGVLSWVDEWIDI